MMIRVDNPRERYASREFHLGENVAVAVNNVDCGTMHFPVPDGAYVEGYTFPGTNTVWVMWTPNGEIKVKPGCGNLEDIKVTIKRLEQLRRTAENSESGRAHYKGLLSKRRIDRWLRLLRSCATYEYDPGDGA